jgi:protein MpaA
MKAFVFGQTMTGLPIMGYRFGASDADPHVFILGGVHGDEIEGIWATNGLLARLASSFDFKLRLTLVPVLNVDGMLARERRNSSGIDLNRNMPSNDWTSEVATERYFPGKEAGSESENKALVDFLAREKPSLIISMHSWKPMLNINGDCRSVAEAISKTTGYVIEETIGYPTPGCLGTYAGLERNMPTITYEVERGLDQASVLREHVPALLNGLRFMETSR